MRTPPMLRPREPVADRVSRDPVVALNVAALTVIGVGLFLAAVLAVYTWSTPGAELPLVIAITLAFVAVLGLNILLLAIRRMARIRAGL